MNTHDDIVSFSEAKEHAEDKLSKRILMSEMNLLASQHSVACGKEKESVRRESFQPCCGAWLTGGLDRPKASNVPWRLEQSSCSTA